MATTAAPTTAARTTEAPTTTTATGLAANVLTVSGSVTATMHEDRNYVAIGCDTRADNSVNGFTSFAADGTKYVLQFSISAGSYTLPDPASKVFVELYVATDSTREWSAGTSVSSAAGGAITFDGTHGMIDVDMLPDTPSPNPALAPIHVTGTFDCPS